MSELSARASPLPVRPNRRLDRAGSLPDLRPRAQAERAAVRGAAADRPRCPRMSEKVFRVGPETVRSDDAPPLSLTTRGTCDECGRNLWHYVTDPDGATTSRGTPGTHRARIIAWRCAGCGSLRQNDEAVGLGQGHSPGRPVLRRPRLK